jgi:hypothetical protein
VSDASDIATRQEPSNKKEIIMTIAEELKMFLAERQPINVRPDAVHYVVAPSGYVFIDPRSRVTVQVEVKQ